MLMQAARTQLIVIDVQEKLLPAMRNPDDLSAEVLTLVAGARRLGVPIIVTEQYPRGLGRSIAPLVEAVGNDARIFEKMAFSAAREADCAGHVAAISRAANRPQLVICGIESHVCVLQSALDFKASGYDVFVVADAVSSRTDQSIDIATQRMEAAEISLVTTEMVLFEWLERAGSEDFRVLSKLIR